MRALLLCVLFCFDIHAAETEYRELFQRAVALQQTGDYAAAIDVWRQALKVRPGYVPALTNLGAALAGAGRLDEAVTQYRAALHSDDTYLPARLNLGIALYKQGHFESAAAEFEQLPPNGNRQSVTLLADCYSHLGENRKVIALLAGDEDGNAEEPARIYMLATALFQDGQIERGRRAIERMERQGNPAQASLLRGIAELTAHDPERAVADLRTAVQHGIAFGGAWSLLGIASRATGDLASAESAFRKALELDPNDFDANVELGSLLLIDRDLEEAGRLIRRSIGLRPSSLPARYQLALLYVAQRKTGEAIQELEALRVAAPDWLEPHVQLTRLYYQVDRPLDGRRERELVEKLQAESQHDTLRRLSGSETVTSTPSPAIPDPSPRF